MDMACSLAILTVNSAWPLADRAGAAWALASSSSSVSTGLVGGRSPIRSVSDSFIIATSLPGLFPFLCRCGPASADAGPQRHKKGKRPGKEVAMMKESDTDRMGLRPPTKPVETDEEEEAKAQ